MIIGIDGNEANVPNPVGVSVYTIQLLERFAQKASKEMVFHIFVKHPPLAHLPPETRYFRYITIPGPFLWSRIFFPLYLRLHRPLDVLFCPAHYSPPGYSGKLVVTIHDLAYYYHPKEFLKKDLYKLRSWTAESIAAADRVIAVSQSTKNDLKEHFPGIEKRTVVIHNGFEKPASLTKTSILKQLQLKPQSYLLFLGTLQPRKNLQILLEALKLKLPEQPDLKLVVVGKQGWMYQSIYDTVEKLDLKNHVLFTGFLPDADVQTLLRNAFCLVHPSLYEGFGIPILEAMAKSCPVIAANRSSLPEVGGSACLYFDPSNAQDLVKQLDKLTTDPQLRTELMNRGTTQVERFSWEKSADQTLSLLVETATR
jgi:glycosyltransferase involved in cell wall biosynthesis